MMSFKIVTGEVLAVIYFVHCIVPIIDYFFRTDFNAVVRLDRDNVTGLAIL